jgi:hypothetical protein
MRGLRTAPVAAIAAAALALALGPASSAEAATLLGDPSCKANQVTTNKTLVQVSGPGQLAAPADGVLTRWQVNGIAEFGAIPQWLKVARADPGESFTIVDEDVGVISGTTSYPTRIPVQAGDLIGLGAEGALFFCSGSGERETGYVNSELLKGSTGQFDGVATVGVPVTAVLEPDADGDGWGDESQDECPQSAEVLVACPKLGLDAYAVQTQGYLRIFTAVYGPGKASISFNGATKIPARLSDTGRSSKVSWKGARPGTEGQFTSVRLKFSRNLIDALRKPGAVLTIKVKVTATNVARLKTTKTLKVKVR